MTLKDVVATAEAYERAAAASERLLKAEQELVILRNNAKELLAAVTMPETVDVLLSAFAKSDPPDDLIAR